ncbi:MAG: PD40 domain-containing protein [Chloroflexia bacterium]|nr:PD40 domain-containing protein [Chloroflexia bacterium]
MFNVGTRQGYSLLEGTWVEFVWDWSPDGHNLLYTSDQATCIINLTTYETTLLLPMSEGSSPPNNPCSPQSQFEGYDHTDLVKKAPENMRWSPTGEWIAYTQAVSTSNEVFLIRPDGSEKTQLTENIHQDYFVDWSADGQKIFTWLTQDKSHELYSLDILSGQRQVIVQHPEPLESWQDLYILDIHSGQQVRIEGLPSPQQANIVIVDPSPDYSYYAIFLARDWFEGFNETKLYLLDVSTEETHIIKDEGFYLLDWGWSPDSDTLAFIAHDFDEHSSDGRGIYLLEPLTNANIEILDTSNSFTGGWSFPSWSLDSEMIAFKAYDDQGETCLTIYSFDSGEFVVAEPLGYYGFTPCHWSPMLVYD